MTTWMMSRGRVEEVKVTVTNEEVSRLMFDGVNLIFLLHFGNILFSIRRRC